MGPTLARMARRAAPEKTIYAVARFSDPAVAAQLESHGVRTVRADLLDRDDIALLPRAPNVILMAGQKFGTTGSPARTWATNTLLPALVAEAMAERRIVAFSTGCVYPFVPTGSGGATEETPLTPPPGEYAASCVGRERLLRWYSETRGTPGRLLRLNYAIDLRYGVLHDVARKVRDGEPVDVTTGHVERDLAGRRERCRAALPGPLHDTDRAAERHGSRDDLDPLAGQYVRRRVRHARADRRNRGADRLAQRREPRPCSVRAAPKVPLETMIRWQVDWLAREMPTLAKPTSFEVRDGTY